VPTGPQCRFELNLGEQRSGADLISFIKRRLDHLEPPGRGAIDGALAHRAGLGVAAATVGVGYGDRKYWIIGGGSFVQE
jgi:hypothetical protein